MPLKSKSRKNETSDEHESDGAAAVNKKARTNTSANSKTKKTPIIVQAITNRSELPSLWDVPPERRDSCFKVISWNVNGIRALMKNFPNALADLVRSEQYPDVVFLQETKLQEIHVDDKKLNLRNLLREEGYESHWSCSTAKKGYAGSVAFIRTSIVREGNTKGENETPIQESNSSKGTLLNFFSHKKNKNKIDSSDEVNVVKQKKKSIHLEPVEDKRRILCEPIELGLGNDKHDKEGRLITLHFPHFSLTALYVPNSGRSLERLDYRVGEWDKDLLRYMQKIETDRNVGVIWLGDLNVAHKRLDVWNDGAKHLAKSAGTTPREKESFTDQLDAGFVDLFRELHPEAEGQYTFWAT